VSLTNRSAVGLNRKLQIKPRKFETFVDENGDSRERCTSVQLILKWGGNLTRLGEKQSINLGQRLRHEMYPDANGGGILRLHSTFRHDLKIKTSDEGRVMKTAAAFAKGLLELEGDLPPILVSLVHKEKGTCPVSVAFPRDSTDCVAHKRCLLPTLLQRIFPYAGSFRQQGSKT
jgi:Histidine phosphatase superfamily (branch 2)